LQAKNTPYNMVCEENGDEQNIQETENKLPWLLQPIAVIVVVHHLS
jgi:hypothetical protein